LGLRISDFLNSGRESLSPAGIFSFPIQTVILAVMERDAAWTLRCVEYISTLLVGGVTAAVVSLLIPSHWPALGGMFLGMLLGMVVLLIVFLGFALLAGPFGILMPGMTAAMITGMVCGMMMTAETAPLLDALTVGALIGLGTAVVFHLYDWSLHGEVSQNETGRDV
jgi:hypothetical protein